MKKKKLSAAKKEAVIRYKKRNEEKTRKQATERKQKERMRKKLLRSREDEMTDNFERMKPVLFKWATFFATWDRYFEIFELVNVAFADGGLRRIKNPKLLSKKAKWIMQDYMRKVRRDNSVDRIIRMYVNKYGVIQMEEEREKQEIAMKTHEPKFFH